MECCKKWGRFQKMGRVAKNGAGFKKWVRLQKWGGFQKMGPVAKKEAVAHREYIEEVVQQAESESAHIAGKAPSVYLEI